MIFPVIESISDVLPHIAGRNDFVHAERDGYQVIDYVFEGEDTFDDPIRLECRGITFDQSGRLIRRPLRKFWNLNQKPGVLAHEVDFSKPHAITRKEDGSMIAPAIVDGRVVPMTRMGYTDVAMKAEKMLADSASAAIEGVLHYGITPIFEFTAPDNRIVIRYDEPQLTLLAARYMVSGAYLSRADLEGMAREIGFPLVQFFPSDWNDANAFLDYARAIRGAEGFVVRFDDGLWVKAKGDDYVLKHKAKDSVLREKNVLALVLNGELDDVIPLLEPEDADQIEQYRIDVLNGITSKADEIWDHVQAGASLDQKAFAVEHQSTIAPELRSLAFQVRSGVDAYDAVKKYLLKNVGSQTNVDATRHLHGARFTLDGVVE